ncbi:MAG: hypothetical protein WC856_04830 [Methylococcaceae bacterium]|jgi:hypothetical protein
MNKTFGYCNVVLYRGRALELVSPGTDSKTGIFFKFAYCPDWQAEKLQYAKPAENPGCLDLSVGYVTNHYRDNW